MTYKTQRRILIATFLFFPVFLLLFFTFFPTLMTFYYGFFDGGGLQDLEYSGLYNFRMIFLHADYFFKPLLNSLYYFLGAIVQMAIGLFLAMLLAFKLKGRNFFKGVLFFPYLINGVAVGLMFMMFFDTGGMLNAIVNDFFGIEKKTLWLLTEPLNNYLLAGVSIWRYVGFNLVMFIAAIQSVPSELFEAAKIDGADSFKVFRRIIFPLIKPIILLNMILAIKGSITVFEVPYTLTLGASGTATYVIQAIELARQKQVGLASALSALLLIIVIIVTVIQKMIFKES